LGVPLPFTTRRPDIGFPLPTFLPVSVFIFTTEIIRAIIFIEDITAAIIGGAITWSMTGLLTGGTMVIGINTSGVSGPLKLAIINEPEKVSKIS
jgi:hypothetical protein